MSEKVVTHVRTAGGSTKFLRSCVNCRKRENPTTLLRVVCDGDRLIPDPERSAPGRGAWVHRKCAIRAIERGAFRWALQLDGPIDAQALLAYITDYETDAKDMTLK